MKLLFRQTTGIRARFLLALTGVVVTALSGSLAAWLAYNNLSSNLVAVSEVHMPSIINATELSAKSSVLTARVPMLITANDDIEMNLSWSLVQGLLSDMRSILTKLDRSDANEPIKQLVVKLAINLEELHKNVENRLILKQRYNKHLQRLSWFQADIQDELSPIIDDISFNISNYSRKLYGVIFNASNAKSFNQRIDLREALLKLGASANLVVSMLHQTGNSYQSELIVSHKLIKYEFGQINVRLQQISSIPSTVSLRQLLHEIEVLVESPTGMFATGHQLLKLKNQQIALQTENQDIVVEMDKLINTKVLKAQQASVDASSESSQVILRGKIIITIAVLAGLALAIWVSWFYVGRSIIVRILELRNSMDKIASGNLKAQVNTLGDDEISAMAKDLVIFRDKALAVEDENTRAIIHNSIVGLIATDEHGVINFFNSTASKIFNISPEEGIGWNFINLIATRDMPQVSTFFSSNTFAYKGSDFVTEVQRTLSIEAPLHIEIAVRPFKQRQRQQYLITVHDITEHKNAEEILQERVFEQTKHLSLINTNLEREIIERKQADKALREAQSELIQAAKLAVLGKVTTNIAHELNQPLSALQANAYNIHLLLKAGSYEKAEKITAKIDKITVRMAETIKRFRVFARRPSQQFSPIYLYQAINTSIELFEHNFKREQIKLRIKNNDMSIKVLGEAISLEQVFINLISNAIQAMDGMNDKQLGISIQQEDDWIHIEIEDSGKGLTDEETKKIFDPFYTTKDTGHGLGIGLSLSHKIISGFGGNLIIAEHSKDVTIFRLSLKSA